MKIGVYGGTFNPPHLGHVTAARAVFELLKLDLLLLVPDREPPHKALPAGSPTPEQRLEMTRLAGEQLGLGDRVQVLDLELKRTGRSYTSDTLAQLKERYPEDELWLLMGTDMFLTIQTWHEAEKILSLAGIATFGRTEADTEELFSVQRDYLYRTYPQARIFTLTIPGVVDVSSTDLRTMLAKGEGVNLLPPAVYGYILREGLYGTRADLKRLPLRELRPIALSYLKNKRIPHVLGTEQEAHPSGGAVRRRCGEGPGSGTTARLHKKAEHGGAAGTVRPVRHPAGRAGAEGPEASPRQDRRGHRPGRVRCGR